MTARLLAALWAVLLAACGEPREPKPASTVLPMVLPNKQTTIDPVMNKLDAAATQEQARRAKLEEATK